MRTQPVSLADTADPVHIAGLAEEVHYKQSPGLGCDPGLDEVRVNVKVLSSISTNTGTRSAVEGGVARRDEAERSGDDLVTFTQSHRQQGSMQAGGAAIHRHGIFGAGVSGKGLLQFADLLSWISIPDFSTALTASISSLPNMGVEIFIMVPLSKITRRSNLP